MINVYLFQPVQAGPLQIKNNASYPSAWLPYATARLWAYVSSFKEIHENYTLQGIFPIRKPIDELVQQINDPHICGFSNYLWNFNYNLALAKRIKEKWPACKIIFGGPEITEHTLSQYPDIIDSTVDGEGELLFKQYLDDFLSNNTKPRYTKERIKNLANLISPYTTGIFARVLKENPGYVWGAIIETNRGCPYACTFCDWGGATNSKISLFDIDLLEKELTWIKEHSESIYMIHLGDANFGIFKERDLAIAIKLAETNIPINTSWSKVYNDYLPKIHEVIGDKNTNFTQIALQSGNKDSLDAIKRKNLSPAEINKILQNNKEKSIATNHEYILGLPLETKESWYKGLTEYLDNGYHKLSLVYFCTILPNTELASPDYKEKYKLETVKTSVSESIMVNDDGILETSEIVKSTSTLSYDELVDCYLFSILLANTYNTGYNRLSFMIANKNFGISGLNFYSLLEKYILEDTVYSAHFAHLRKIINEMFETGTITDPLYFRGARIDHLSYTFFFKNKARLLDITARVFLELTKCDIEFLNKVMKVQKDIIFDLSQANEFISTVDFDLVTYLPKTQRLKIKQKITKKEILSDFTNGRFIHLHIGQSMINEYTDCPSIPIISV